MKHRYLITGAAGFIGSHLIDYLLKQGIPESSIRVVLRPQDKLLRSGDFSIIYGDLTNPTVAKKAVDGVSIIYHLAAISGFGGVTIDDYRKGNVLPTKNLFEAVKKKPLKKFVMFSTIAVYGLPSDVGNILGWDETHPQTYSEIYGQSKAEAEALVRSYHNQYKIPYTIVRPVSVYGPRDRGQLFGVYKAISKNYFFLIGNGDNTLDFIFVQDLVRGVHLAQQSKRNASDYILGSGNPTAMKDVAKHIALSINKSPRFLKIPKNLALPISYGLDFLGNSIGIQSPLFPSRVRIMTASYYYNISKAKKELGFNPSTSFKEGAAISGEWYLQSHLL